MTERWWIWCNHVLFGVNGAKGNAHTYRGFIIIIIHCELLLLLYIEHVYDIIDEYDSTIQFTYMILLEI